MQIDTRLGRYRILAKIGQGGMGQVFRAEDERLRREVAIKVLPEELARDAERLARLEREAQLLAALDHPSIAAIHGLEEETPAGASDPVRFLVMQLADGETLAERLAQGAMPFEEALPIALQVAQGLEAAHDKGIVHRDLKPANVQLAPDGTVKILDFGLAKAFAADGSPSSPEVSASPTMLEATRAGVILGTAGYMSPEQARGQRVDGRTDIWAFGCLLFEMLTGTHTFPGETVTDVLGGIVHKEPDWDLLPARTPRRIRALLRRCLRKDVRRRIQAIGDARVSVEEYLEDPVAAEAILDGASPATAGWMRALPWAVAVALAVALVASLLGRSAAPAGDERPRHLQSVVGINGLFLQAGPAIAVSPDASEVVLVEGNTALATGVRLLSRSLAAAEFSELAPSIAYNPFFSPDGKWVGFVDQGTLQKVPVTGGTPLTVAEVARSRGATWGPDGTIVYAPAPNSGLLGVSAEGGEPHEVTTLGAGETTHRWPQFLPDGRHVLFTSHTSASDFDRALLEVVDLDSGERTVVHRGGTFGRYVESGHIVYGNSATLFAIPFDVDSLQATGSAVPVVADVDVNEFEGHAQFAVAKDGTLVYRAAQPVEIPTHVAQWVDRDGRASVLWDTPATYVEPRVSPDGNKVAFMVLAGSNWDVWVYDASRDVSTRLTFDPAFDGPAVWSPDGEYVILSSDRDGATNLYRRRADGSGELEQLTSDPETTLYVSDWSSDGRYVLITAQPPGGSNQLWVLDLQDSGGTPAPYLDTGFAAAEATFSPNGRWVAYQSNESGQQEVYVRPFPAAGGKWQVSDGGGNYPHWSADGTELFYRSDEGIMVAPVDISGATFSTGRVRELFSGSFRGGSQGIVIGTTNYAHYDVAPDGRFVLFPAPPAVDTPNVEWVEIVENWFTELRQRAPAGR